MRTPWWTAGDLYSTLNYPDSSVESSTNRWVTFVTATGRREAETRLSESGFRGRIEPVLHAAGSSSMMWAIYYLVALAGQAWRHLLS